MNVLRTLILLAGVIGVVQFPILLGHALSAHESRPVLAAGVLIVVGIVLLAAAMRFPDRRAGGH